MERVSIPIQATSVGTPDDDIINLTIGAAGDNEMESRRVNQSQIMQREISDADESNKTWTVCINIQKDVSVTLHGAFARGGEEFEIRGILNDNHMPSSCASPIDDPVELNCPSRASLERLPGRHCIVSWRDIDLGRLGWLCISITHTGNSPIPPVLQAAKAEARGGPRSVDLSATAP